MTGAEREALRAAMQLPYPSFPCNEIKRPTTKNGFKDAALPAHGLATLWLRSPGELIGVPCGEASGFAVLDVDVGKGGDVWWSANKERLPQTRLHETRSGGLHVLSIIAPGSSAAWPRSRPASMCAQRAGISSGGRRPGFRLSIMRSRTGLSG
jgi:hypothetical protein